MALRQAAAAGRLRVLFAASEAWPLAKTGGLADVAHSLPAALAARGVDVRVVIPAYRGCRDGLPGARAIGALTAGDQRFEVLEGRLAAPAVTVWLLDAPALFDRPGDPYHDADGVPWSDNALRFGRFCDAVAGVAAGAAGVPFRPDVVHANDWQTGLALPWLHDRAPAVARVFTIHNLAYQGTFPQADALRLGVPAAWWHMDGVEYYGQLSFLKAGVVHAHQITTVSPTYAQEIQRPEFGHGLDGLLRARASQLHGIRNGIDDAVWNPATDAWLTARYDADTADAGKRANKAALQEELGLVRDPDVALVGMITRFAHQKGVDLLLEAVPQLRELPVQFAVLGVGERGTERQMQAWARATPGRIAVRIGHDERLAHRIEAASDIFLMPSRYEPCGLNQMYSQRYGAVPVVRHTGGLADTVTDSTPGTLAAGTATGVHFLHPDAAGLAYGLRRALELRARPAVWAAMRRAGMLRDFSWSDVAERYLDLYRSVASRGEADPDA